MQANSISQLMILMFVAIGGALGACSRYLISELLITILGRGFPYGTLFVNIIGSAMLGGLIGAFERELLASELWRLVIGLGYLGAFTTFSTFSMDNVLLLQQGDILKTGLNISLNLLLSIISAYLCFTAVKGWISE